MKYEMNSERAYAMNWFERWVLKRIANRLVIQSEYHKRNIIEYYKIIIKSSTKRFHEDNKPTLESFLEECHNFALWETFDEL